MSARWRARWVRLAIAVALMSTMAPMAGLTAGQRKPVRRTVTIDATSYQPARLVVTAGDTVVWANNDLFPHTVTSKAAKIASRSIAAGDAWSYTTSVKGEIAYVCDFHPTMAGTLVVR